MNILIHEFQQQGMNRVYENPHWMVGIKNWKPMNDIAGIDRLERHNETDELFILLNGRCTLLFANETAEGLQIEYLPMEPMKVYQIPAGLWHNTVTQKDTKLALIENSNTCSDNSDELPLAPEQVRQIQAALAG